MTLQDRLGVTPHAQGAIEVDGRASGPAGGVEARRHQVQDTVPHDGYVPVLCWSRFGCHALPPLPSLMGVPVP
ncbi:hypothetical protein ACFFX0_06225 [Citricoccus parietis]|uniref:Uncharacterized protein n=1 Tax=Citricoccus parietis TaxID=592307 RepID=A0ABV5FVW6_9MICC